MNDELIKLGYCKRMLVVALAHDENSERFEIATNKNPNNNCTGVAGKCGCVHAEINVLKKFPNPHAVFVTHSPCLDCAKALVKAGVKIVRYEHQYRILDGLNYLKVNGVTVIKVGGESYDS